MKKVIVELERYERDNSRLIQREIRLESHFKDNFLFVSEFLEKQDVINFRKQDIPSIIDALKRISKDIDINCEECKRFTPNEPSKCSSGHLLKEGSQGVECPDYQPNIPNKKVFMLETCVIGQHPHFQIIFASKLLARQAGAKYLNDPACKRDMMDVNIRAYKVHTDLTILDSVTKDVFLGRILRENMT